MHILIARCYDAVEAAQLDALTLHVLHAAAEVQDQVVTQAVCDFHAPLECISLSRREDDIHLLICEMVLQKLLVLKVVRGACN